MIAQYTNEIWNIIGLKENQNLSTKQQQDLISNVLLKMKQEVESIHKENMKVKIKQAFENSLDLI